MLSTEKRERLLGQLMLGTGTRTACDSLGILYCDLLQELDDNEPFRFAYLSAQAQRDRVSRALEAGTE
jgi:hypothetical protein